MSRTIVLILVLIVSAAGLLALSLNLQSPRPKVEIPVALAQTTLSLTAPRASSSSATFTSNVIINTGTNKATAVQLELSYNPEDITNVDIKPGTFFKTSDELLKKIDTQNGRISYALGVGLGKKGIAGSGIFAIIYFDKLKTSGTTSIDFLPKSLVSAEGVAQTVLRSTMGTKFDLFTTPSTPSAR